MAEAFKDLLNATTVAATGRMLATGGSLAEEAFVARATAGLDKLELKARVRHVADAIRAALPGPWPQAVDALVRSLPPPYEGEDRLSAGLFLWPVATVVEVYGLEHPELSLPALRAITQHASAEFAIRPYLVRWPDQAWVAAEAWSRDTSLHVRRLASEGTRPRLPWGQRLAASVADPSRGLALIERLVDDPSAYVRRSVANHLGDVAKDHPALAVEVARRWLPGRRRLVEHALRDLLKKGHPGALELLGHAGHIAVGEVAVSPAEAVPGGSVEVTATLTGAGTARVDLVWAWPSPRGWASKTFRGAVRQLSQGESWQFRQRLSLRPVTTRPLRPGEQRVFLRVNGQDHGPATFILLDASPPGE